MHNQAVGNLGEDLAVDFLKQKGYVIINRNLKLSYFELDIIAQIGSKIAFIEVKTKATTDELWDPEDLLTPRKYQAFKKAVQMYCTQNKIALNDINLELIAIDLTQDKMANIKHYTDII